jgi:hypothetical protein
MKHVRTFESFRNNKAVEPINEEFVLGLLKGALSKVMAAFGNTFKDMANDFKNAFKADDPNSIKGIIMTNFNQAVDGAQKNLNDKAVDEAGVTDMMNKMIDSLVGLATGIDKDIDTAVGKDKSAGAKAVAKAIILGSKEAAWAGIVGLLDPTKGKSGIKTTYKYSKMNYDLSLAKLPDLKAKKTAASKFLDNMQKDIQSQLDKEFSEEEIEKLYKDSMDKAKQGGGDDEEILKAYGVKTFDELVKKQVSYKRDDFDDNKKPEEQADMIATGELRKVDGDNLTIYNDKIKKEIKKAKEDLLAPAKVAGQEDLVKTLGDLKTKNADSIPKLNDIAKLYADPTANKAKIDAIEKELGA